MDGTFIKAFNNTMLWEVGPKFKPTDPEVINGSNLKKCGYVNNPKDPGGETKFGVSKKQYPTLDVKGLTLEDTMTIYKKDYWLKAMCYTMPPEVALIHFDACVNHNMVKAVTFLQNACGAVSDGKIGPRTISKLQTSCSTEGTSEIVRKMLEQREKYFRALVANKPDLGVFLAGWLNRIEGLRKLSLG